MLSQFDVQSIDRSLQQQSDCLQQIINTRGNKDRDDESGTWYFTAKSLADDMERLSAGDTSAKTIAKTVLDADILALSTAAIANPELGPVVEALMEPCGLVRLRGGAVSNPAGTHPAGLVAPDQRFQRDRAFSTDTFKESGGGLHGGRR